jgi:hypothetical protein
MVGPRSRTSSSGRTAHAPSRSSLSPYSCVRRLRVAGVGCSAAGSTAKTGVRWPSAPRRHPRQKTHSPSPHKACRPLSPSGSNRENGLNCRTPSPGHSLKTRRDGHGHKRSARWAAATTCTRCLECVAERNSRQGVVSLYDCIIALVALFFSCSSLTVDEALTTYRLAMCWARDPVGLSMSAYVTRDTRRRGDLALPRCEIRPARPLFSEV